MKKILSLALMGLMVLCLPMMTACSGHKTVNLTIANFANYDRLSVGYQNQIATASTLSTVEGTADTFATKKKLKLLGKHKDGYYEQVEFEEEQDGKTITKNYHINSIDDIGPFLFVGYTKHQPAELKLNLAHTDNYSYVLALDKSTGKMFDISDYSIIISRVNSYSASPNALFTTGTSSGKTTIIKMYVTNNTLHVEEILERPTDFNLDGWLVDKYNNMFFQSLQDDTKTYVLTSQGQLKTLTNATFAFNDIMYVGNQWVNANGELENATFVPDDFINLKVEAEMNYRCKFLYQENNNFYYRNSTENKIVKYSFTNDIEYSIEIIEMQNCLINNSGIAFDKKLYFRSGTEVFYVDITTGQAKTLSSDYFFNKLYIENDALIFEALDTYRNNVKGEIDPITDEVTIGVTPKQYEIFYIAALN